MDIDILEIALKHLINRKDHDFPDETSDEHIAIKKQIDNIIFLITYSYQRMLED
ncbi:MAG: hypothetical protein QM478_13525 [Flavobacteriaceae bacterium]